MIHVIYDVDGDYGNLVASFKLYEGPDRETHDLIHEYRLKEREARLDEPKDPTGPELEPEAFDRGLERNSAAWHQWMLASGLVEIEAARKARAAKVAAFEEEYGETWLDYLVMHHGFTELPFKEYQK